MRNRKYILTGKDLFRIERKIKYATEKDLEDLKTSLYAMIQSFTKKVNKIKTNK